jgi:hypothetical protein
MRFEYTPYEGNWSPLLPVVFKYKKKSLPAIGALADTGATHTILPMEIAAALGIKIDLEDRIETQVAGGSKCYVYPYRLPDQEPPEPSGMPVAWTRGLRPQAADAEAYRSSRLARARPS